MTIGDLRRELPQNLMDALGVRSGKGSTLSIQIKGGTISIDRT